MNIVTVYLGLGSNLGNREDNLSRALSFLGKEGTVTALSSVYETEPWGYTPQPSFLNLVCAVETSLSPWELLELAQEVEQKLGGSTPSDMAPELWMWISCFMVTR